VKCVTNEATIPVGRYMYVSLLARHGCALGAPAIRRMSAPAPFP
jgi:hypothetical protein